jgi:hypothetical protein
MNVEFLYLISPGCGYISCQVIRFAASNVDSVLADCVGRLLCWLVVRRQVVRSQISCERCVMRTRYSLKVIRSSGSADKSLHA